MLESHLRYLCMSLTDREEMHKIKNLKKFDKF